MARGVASCAIADIRPESATFGQQETFWLGDPPQGERRRLFVSDGLDNAFLAMGDGPVDHLYDVTAEWRPEFDKRAVAWNDPDLGVDWPVERPALSDADQANPPLRSRFR